MGTEARLKASDGEAGGRFGFSVSVSGNVAVIGKLVIDTFADGFGAAYVYRFNGSSWEQEQKLTAHDENDLDWFGYSVSVFGDVAVIGAPVDDDLSSNSGAAYVFRFNGTSWDEEQKLIAEDGAGEDLFGRSVSLFGDVIVVGADGDDGLIGSAYVFRYNGSTWEQEQKLTAKDRAAIDSFGYSVSVFGDVAVIGAYLDEDLGEQSGSAYVFRYNGSSWEQEQKLTASDGEAGDRFGYSVSVSGEVTVIGAYGDDNLSGSAYMFRFNGSEWVQEHKLIPSERPEPPDTHFGFSVSVFCDVGVIGAPNDDGLATRSGAAYVFAFPPPTPCEAVCGNDIREGNEQCDGTQAAACPGHCMLDCTCEPGTKIPAVAEWGLIVLALLVLTRGSILLGRRANAAVGFGNV